LINIYRLFPDALNLNGDAANALILAKRLAWYKKEATVVDISNEEELQLASKEILKATDRSVVVAGHGSLAAMKSLAGLSKSLRSFFKLIDQNGVCAILVGSSTSWSHRASAATQDRVSEFVTVEFGLPGWPPYALGYVNSDLRIPALQVSNNVVTTLLHGPFLAKNPQWADAIISRLGVDVQPTVETQAVDNLVTAIWKLESKKLA